MRPVHSAPLGATMSATPAGRPGARQRAAMAAGWRVPLGAAATPPGRSPARHRRRCRAIRGAERTRERLHSSRRRAARIAGHARRQQSLAEPKDGFASPTLFRHEADRYSRRRCRCGEPPMAGGPTAICRSGAARSAGRTCGPTPKPTPRGWPAAGKELGEPGGSAGTLAGATGLEPATSGVTGRRSNQLSYAPWRAGIAKYRSRARKAGCGRGGARRNSTPVKGLKRPDESTRRIEEASRTWGSSHASA